MTLCEMQKLCAQFLKNLNHLLRVSVAYPRQHRLALPSLSILELRCLQSLEKMLTFYSLQHLGGAILILQKLLLSLKLSVNLPL